MFDRRGVGYNRMAFNTIVSKTHNPIATASDVSSGVSNVRVTFLPITMVYSGTLGIGQTVCIDSTKYTVTLDGANALSNFSGDFPKLVMGNCDITYTDSEASRTVKVSISRRERLI